MLSTLLDWKLGLSKVSFYMRLRNPNGIARRVLGVGKLLFLMHFYCCHLFKNHKNCRTLSEEQLIFMSRNGNLLFTMIWTLYFFSEKGKSVLFSKNLIWTVGVGWLKTCKLYVETLLAKILYTECFYWLWIPPHCHWNKCHGRFFVDEVFRFFQQLRSNQVGEERQLLSTNC